MTFGDADAIAAARLRHVLETYAKPLVSYEVIEEHRLNPFGKHSAELDSLLNLLRRNPDPSRPVPVIACAKEREEYYLAELPGERGRPIRILWDEGYGSEEEAAHAVFLRRLERLAGDAPHVRAEDPPLDETTREAVVGYCDRYSAAAGQTVRFFVSCEGVASYQVDLVRLIHGNPDPAGPGFKCEPVVSPINREYRGRRQETAAGSYGLVGDCPALRLQGSFSIQAMIWPTTPGAGLQGLLTKWLASEEAGYGLFVDEGGCVAGCLGDGAGTVAWLRAEQPLRRGVWYLVGLSFDEQAGLTRIWHAPVMPAARVAVPGVVVVERVVDVAPKGDNGAPFVIAGATRRLDGVRALIEAHFNGKIDRPRVASRALDLDEALAWIEQPGGEGLVAAWDLSEERDAEGSRSVDLLVDRSSHGLHGRLVNLPTRAVTGYNWSGKEHRFADAPREYGAVHFHADDLEDAGWEVDFELTVPRTAPSGVYAARLRARSSEDLIPFVVRPEHARPSADIALLLPTNTYLAYANNCFPLDTDLWERVAGRFLVLKAQDLHQQAHREYAASLYDTHSDGSGVAYSSWLRPILTLRPIYSYSQHPHPGVVTGASAYGLNADLCLVDWLTEKGYRFDVFTDRDLHVEGSNLLGQYRVILTGSHPEYWTEAMLDGLESYLGGGGRLMYMGGNGFYWVTAFHPTNPNIVEVRRSGGTETWTARPGEHHLSFTGEPGGLWRNRGRPPQKLVGVGMIAQNGDESSSYRRTRDSLDPRAAWIFEGVGLDEPIGDFGLLGGGAAGHEIDVYDAELGSPPNTLVLASSDGHSELMLEVRENLPMSMPHVGGSANPNVRADLVYFTTPAGGAVFSVGSLTWCGSLSYNGYDNNVSRITDNVLSGFLTREELPG